MRIKIAAVTVLCLASAVAVAQGFDAKAAFKQKCAMCHGPDGTKPTTIGANLGALDLSSEKVQKMSDKELHETIEHGKAKMPAFGSSLGGDKNVNEMVKYVRSMKK